MPSARGTSSMWAHDRNRFETMSVRQLWTRLGRIRDVEKLHRFEALAREKQGIEYVWLANMAAVKRQSIRGGMTVEQANAEVGRRLILGAEPIPSDLFSPGVTAAGSVTGRAASQSPNMQRATRQEAVAEKANARKEAKAQKGPDFGVKVEGPVRHIRFKRGK